MLETEGVENNQPNKKGDVDSNQIVQRHVIPVAAAALVDRAILHPFDTVATVQQYSNRGMRSSFKDIFHKHGFKGFYAGFLGPLVTAIPMRISIYTTYFVIRDHAKDYYPSISAGTTMLLAGIISGVVETTIVCPSESYRTRKACQVDMRDMYKFNGLFRGYFPLLFRTTTENTIALAGSDIMLKTLPSDLRDKPFMPYLTGTISGMISQIVITPIDLVKTRVMSDSQNRSISTHLGEIWKTKGFFKSAPSKLARMGLGNGLILGTIEVVRRILDKESNNDGLEINNKKSSFSPNPK